MSEAGRRSGRWRRLLCGSLLLVGLGSAFAAPSPGQEPAERMLVERVAEGVYAVRQPENLRFYDSNSAIILRSDHAIVVDSQSEPDATQAVIGHVRRLTDKPVRYLLTTHFHGDHVYGNAAWQQAFPGLALLAHDSVPADITARAVPDLEKEIARLAAEIETVEARLAQGVDEQGAPLAEAAKADWQGRVERAKARLAGRRALRVPAPSLTYASRLTLHDPAGAVELRHHRAHTRGDTLVYLPRQRVLYTGDVLDDLPYGGHGYPREWLAALREIEALDVDVMIPGHGQVRRGKEHVRLVRRMVESLLEQVEKAAREGRSLEETKGLVDLEEFHEALVVDERSERMWKDSFADTVERAWLEATGALPES